MKDKLYNMSFAKVYPLYVAKALKKQRILEEVNTIISWLTGYQIQQIEHHANSYITLNEFFTIAPHMNPKRHEIKGTICGVRVEAIDVPL